MTIREAIRAEALNIGFDAVGFTRATLASQIGEELSAFCAAGYHGDMGWLAEKKDLRANPTVLWPEAKSTVAFALCYPQTDIEQETALSADQGKISIYARHRDYHDILKKKLRAIARFVTDHYGGEVKIFVDTAPVMEKPLAQQAGLGWQGKHTNLVSRDLGSWFFLGFLFTTLVLAPDNTGEDHCGTCQACLDICPTKAFLGPHRLQATKCVSYLTIEHKGPVAPELRPLLGNRIYGCDDCLAVCPWNKFAKAATDPGLMPRAELNGPALAKLLVLDDATFRAFFRFSPIKRIGRNRFLRNVLYAAGNSGEPHLAHAVQPLLRDASPLVRGAAIWALRRLLPLAEFTPLAVNDEDPEVRHEWQLALGQSI